MTPTPAAPSISGADSPRLARLKAAPRKPGEARFFYWDAHFSNDAVKVLPGEYFVHDEDLLITTTVGSCIAACLWDRQARVGGMNHFMLPDGGGLAGDSGGSAGRYGGYAMELLINELQSRGATRATLEAKVFGGGAVMGVMSSINVGERNTRFVLDYLQTERIPVISQDVMDTYPRKVCFLPASGKAMVKRLASAFGAELTPQDPAANQRNGLADGSVSGSVDLF